MVDKQPVSGFDMGEMSAALESNFEIEVITDRHVNIIGRFAPTSISA